MEEKIYVLQGRHEKELSILDNKFLRCEHDKDLKSIRFMDPSTGIPLIIIKYDDFIESSDKFMIQYCDILLVFIDAYTLMPSKFKNQTETETEKEENDTSDDSAITCVKHERFRGYDIMGDVVLPATIHQFIFNGIIDKDEFIQCVRDNKYVDDTSVDFTNSFSTKRRDRRNGTVEQRWMYSECQSVDLAVINNLLALKKSDNYNDHTLIAYTGIITDEIESTTDEPVVVTETPIRSNKHHGRAYFKGYKTTSIEKEIFFFNKYQKVGQFLNWLNSNGYLCHSNDEYMVEIHSREYSKIWTWTCTAIPDPDESTVCTDEWKLICIGNDKSCTYCEDWDIFNDSYYRTNFVFETPLTRNRFIKRMDKLGWDTKNTDDSYEYVAIDGKDCKWTYMNIIL